jgi:hypothetical protein
LCLTNSALRYESVLRCGYKDSRFFDLGTSWRWVVIFLSRPFYHWEETPRDPLVRRLVGPQSQSGRNGEGKILGPTGTRNPTSWSSSLSLYRLSICSIKHFVFCFLSSSCWFLALLIFRSWRWKRHVHSKRRLPLNVTLQMTELFITTAIRTSNCRNSCLIHHYFSYGVWTFSLNFFCIVVSRRLQYVTRRCSCCIRLRFTLLPATK